MNEATVAGDEENGATSEDHPAAGHRSSGEALELSVCAIQLKSSLKSELASSHINSFGVLRIPGTARKLCVIFSTLHRVPSSNQSLYRSSKLPRLVYSRTPKLKRDDCQMGRYTKQRRQSSTPCEEGAEQSPLRKRTRHENKSNVPVCKHRPMRGINRDISLLGLPDKALSLIFSFLNAGDTSLDLLKPRHAFSLAITNTRLLPIFRTHLIRVVPHLDTEYLFSVSPEHMLSVMRIAGPCLRELHVPASCLSILSNVPVLCPRVEKIILQDSRHEKVILQDSSDEDGNTDIAKLNALPLRSLSIDDPSKLTLKLLIRPLPEITLLNCSSDKVFSLLHVMRNPPKKLHLELDIADDGSIGELLDQLREVCMKVEDFTLKTLGTPDNVPRRGCLRIEKLVTLLSKIDRHRNSRCKRMVLKGDLVIDFVEYAHPEAHIEVTTYGQTFVDDGDRIYATRIPLWDEYLTQDLSRITDVYFVQYVRSRWTRLLQSIHLKQAYVDCGLCPTGLLGQVETVVLDMYCEHQYPTNWDWIQGAKKVRIVDSRNPEYARGCRYIRFRVRDHVISFMGSLASLIDQFQGEIVCLEHYDYPPLEKTDYVLRALVSFIREAVDKFEARGGDASTVRYMIENITRD